MRMKNDGMSQKDIAAKKGCLRRRSRVLSRQRVLRKNSRPFPCAVGINLFGLQNALSVGDEMGNKNLEFDQLIQNIPRK